MFWYTTSLVGHTVSKNPDSAYQSVWCILKIAITELQEHMTNDVEQKIIATLLL